MTKTLKVNYFGENGKLVQQVFKNVRDTGSGANNGRIYFLVEYENKVFMLKDDFYHSHELIDELDDILDGTPKDEESKDNNNVIQFPKKGVRKEDKDDV